MIVYFADRAMNIIGQASTELPQGLLISGDLKREDVEAGVKTFDGYISYVGADERKAVETMTTPGNYLLRSSKGEGEFYTIIDSELDTDNGQVYIYAEDAGLDLLNQIVGAFEAAQAMTIAQYTALFAEDSGFEIGVNEVSNYSRKLAWDGETTVTERLRSLATQFDAEISFSFELDRLHVLHKYINFWKKRGKDTGVELRMGRQISAIRVRKSVANLATALYVTGGTPDGEREPITLDGYSYDDGDIFITGSYMISRSALIKWSRYVSPDETGDGVGNIFKIWSYDTTSQSELCTRAVEHLRQISDPEVNYDVEIAELPDDVRIGDRARVIDEEGEMYLEARILLLETSEADHECKATLGEYILRDSGLSEQMNDLQKKVQDMSTRIGTGTYVAITIVSHNATTGQTVLAATLYVEGEEKTPTTYSWTKAGSTTVLGTGATLTVTDTNAAYDCKVTW